MSNLHQLVDSFYNAIIKAKPLPFPYESFPHGCCQDTAWILKRFLDEYGHGQSYIHVVGGQRHAWLEQNGLIIDLTYKQFEAANQQYDNYYITLDRTLHEGFEIEYSYPLPYWKTYTDQPTITSLNLYYNHVVKHLEG
ncbi:hypothetical protein [Paenibacillus sp. NPDC058071]|uniref:hypothetical protein n=1 Tax=Paenibacillus sp. NPDC058071 TaxID=3346326 RepID=UPI0036DB1746